VPYGFTITTKACALFYEKGKKLDDDVKKQILEKQKELELVMAKKLGDKFDPLLVSVRSGAFVSMPGMMDTILNLGLNDETVVGLANKTNNERFAFDSYRRFIQMFGDVAMNVKREFFEEILDHIKNERRIKFDNELSVYDLKKIVDLYKQLIEAKTGRLFPLNVYEQLEMAIIAVFNSWNNDRAITYRRMYNIQGLLGTAVTVQSMVFGNMSDDSGTGVCFTRNPSTGENKFYGEFLMNAQGEDVVAGIRTPRKIEELDKIMPETYLQLVNIRKLLEDHYKDMQDIEFTIEQGKLYILQTRNGKRTANASVKIAVEMVEEGLINKETALLRIDANSLNQLLHKQLDPLIKKNAKILAKGLPASPGAAVGKIVFNAKDAYHWSKDKGEKVILVRTETSPEDIEGMNSSQGILTARGGMTSHAAVVARGMGKCCVAGCLDLSVDDHLKILEINGIKFHEGDIITIDGSTGDVFYGALALVEPSFSFYFQRLMEWADKTRRLSVRTNVDTPKDAETAFKFGAEGIGLCRTEHMFFEESRIKAVREMILAETKNEREKALLKILPMQISDFKSLFEIMKDYPVTIRFLDPPLHEFLPREEKAIIDLSKELNVSVEKLKEKIEELHEFNPMLGHRGCRLGIVFPEITEMQSRAVFEAAAEIIKEQKKVTPEIMIPLVGHVKEFENQKKIIDDVALRIMKEKGVEIEYKVGTMIEVPRGAITADQIATNAEFFSFGTNDLTQMGCGFSRDDSGKFLKHYMDLTIYKCDPFESLDQDGVGELMKIAISKAKPIRPNIKFGICGEHGGDPESVIFCHKIGLNYVSCSPYRVPVARLAASQAAIREKIEETEKSYKDFVNESISKIKKKFGESININDLEKELTNMITSKKSKEYGTA
jgi:pyruvate,orthophosphate dikinase